MKTPRYHPDDVRSAENISDFLEWLLTSFNPPAISEFNGLRWLEFDHKALPDTRLFFNQTEGKALLIIPNRAKCADVDLKATEKLETFHQEFADYVTEFGIVDRVGN